MSQREHPVSRDTPDFDPCFYEAKKVIDCINDTKTRDKSECSRFAENTKSCRTFWREVRKDRRKKGIQPELPPVNERPKVMEEYRDLLEDIKVNKNNPSCVIQ